uniref:Zinc transporter foi n=1 Tax=Schistocephalus solidus TaxID=70667 RepID=A0A0X3PPJ3_SCHSO
MCANCKHTGCWLFLSVMLLLVLDLPITCAQKICQLTGNATYNLRTLSLSSPIVQNIVQVTKSTISESNFTKFKDDQASVSPTIDCPTLYKFISSFHLQNETTPHSSSGAFNVKPEVWIASTVGVVIISAVGLLGVAIVPLVNKKFYNDVIQFLVALAVGCLTGDAFLHLLPHAIAGGHAHEEAGAEGEENGEREAMLKGLVALVGVYFFFCAEKLVSSISEYKAEKKAEEEERERILKNPRKSGDIRRLSAFRESISVNSGLRRSSRLPGFEPTRRQSRAPSILADDILTTGITAKAMKNVDVLSAYAEENEEDLNSETGDGNLTLRVPSITINKPSVTSEEESSKPIKTGKSKNHGHACGDEASNADDVTIEQPKKDDHHGHSHAQIRAWLKVPGSMAAIAWMVIMGDGLHNFTDGMAIGVAFTASIAGGISTTVAVFCHELPHELGDFAVLLRTGMRIKEALFFNVVSSILCLIGMFVGIGVGNIESASTWIFALTAGTFIYIALVDMLPELNTAEVKPGRSRTLQMIIQNLGLITGAGIMFLIAFYEENLLKLVN